MNAKTTKIAALMLMAAIVCGSGVAYAKENRRGRPATVYSGRHSQMESRHNVTTTTSTTHTTTTTVRHEHNDGPVVVGHYPRPAHAPSRPVVIVAPRPAPRPAVYVTHEVHHVHYVGCGCHGYEEPAVVEVHRSHHHHADVDQVVDAACLGALFGAFFGLAMAH